MRIFLADLAHTASVQDRSIPVPLNIGYMAAHAKATHGDAIEVKLFKHPDLLLKEAVTARPDVVGLSNYGWSQELTTAVGRYLRERLPGSVFVAGGPNIDQEEDRLRRFLGRNAYLDYLVVDGGEEPFSELVGQLLAGRRPADDPPANVCFLRGDEVVRMPSRRLTRAIEGIPSPYLGGFLDEFLERGMVPLFETNRGCPFSCTFCAWGDASKNLVRRFDLDTSIAEVHYVGERSTALNWIVCDANFGILERDIEIARHIRQVRDERGYPKTCHVWLAKNVTERNLTIGEILGDMTVPVMAVQSLDDEVLRNIKRSNISTQTYVEYQRKFHKIGSTTYSDFIVPLPGETLQSHLDGLAELFDYGVDEIACHNMRLLAGAEAASDETREAFAFRTRYRLIHGDAGIYGRDIRADIRCFEYEESLRSTSTMSEDEMFYLRRLHFLVDALWNGRIYKPLLRVMALYGVNQVKVFTSLLRVITDMDGIATDAATLRDVRAFFDRFEAASHAEWFDSPAAIEKHFLRPENFRRLLDQEFEKLNIQYAMLLMRDHKAAFDRVLRDLCDSFGRVPADVLGPVCAFTFASFPPLTDIDPGRVLQLPRDLAGLNELSVASYRPSSETVSFVFTEGERRKLLRGILASSEGKTLSKILNTQNLSISALRLSSDPELTFDAFAELPEAALSNVPVKGSWRQATA